MQVASPLSGSLIQLNVTRGEQVTKGSTLFSLEQNYEIAAVKQHFFELERAQKNLANLEKGKRPSELASIKARLLQAKASSQLAYIEYKRRVRLIKEKTISQEELDRAKSDYEQKDQQVREINAELTTARLGARDDEIQAAAANVLKSQAALEQAQWNQDQKTQVAPVSGVVFDTLYRVGEWVGPGNPIVTLLPPQNIEVRFFIPESLLGDLSMGQEVHVHYDGIQDPIQAHIIFISPTAEYNPPVIYSSENRAKLVFMIKAKSSLEDATRLHPGQPVDVRIPTLTP